MTIFEALGIGVACGMKTVDEAVNNIHFHFPFSYHTMEQELIELEDQAVKFKEAFGNEIPQYFHRVENQLMDYYFKYEAKQEEPTDGFD